MNMDQVRAALGSNTKNDETVLRAISTSADPALLPFVLHWPEVFHDLPRVVTAVLERGCPANSQSILSAANLGLLPLLVQYGADVDVRDTRGTPYQIIEGVAELEYLQSVLVHNGAFCPPTVCLAVLAHPRFCEDIAWMVAEMLV